MTVDPSVPPGGYWKHDGDADDSQPASRHEERDDQAELDSYGPQATPIDERAIAALVKRYYAATAIGDGATACLLLNSSFAAQLAQSQRQPGRSGGESCPAAIAPLLARQHQQLTREEVTTMIVIGARRKGNEGLAVLGFRHMPESTILVERQGDTWRIGELFGNELE